MPHNNHSIAVQIMQQFLRDNGTLTASFPEEFNDELKPLFPRYMQISGSLAESTSLTFDLQLPEIPQFSISSPDVNIELPKHCS